MTGTRVALMLADGDGTLVTSDEVLTDRTVQAVSRLHHAGIALVPMPAQCPC